MYEDGTTYEYELAMLEGMEPYDRRFHLINQDLHHARWMLEKLRAELEYLHHEEEHYIRMGKKYLKHYNEYELEEDWNTAEQYIELARNVKGYRASLRDSLPEITELVRRYKKEWQQVKKMNELQQKLMLKQHKN